MKNIFYGIIEQYRNAYAIGYMIGLAKSGLEASSKKKDEYFNKILEVNEMLVSIKKDEAQNVRK